MESLITAIELSLLAGFLVTCPETPLGSTLRWRGDHKIARRYIKGRVGYDPAEGEAEKFIAIWEQPYLANAVTGTCEKIGKGTDSLTVAVR